MNQWQVYHAHKKLVRRGLANELKCESCDWGLITTLGPEDVVALLCTSCGKKVIPGLAFDRQIEAIVKEHLEIE